MSICCENSFNMFLDFLPSIAIVVSIAGGIIGLNQYVENSKMKRAEILGGLVDKFYFREDFKEVREWLDKGGDNKMSDVEFNNKIDDKVFQAKFSDYLNYFQFIVSLKKLAQLKDADIAMMFHYYLLNLKGNESVMKYIKINGYKELNEYLTSYQYAK